MLLYTCASYAMNSLVYEKLYILLIKAESRSDYPYGTSGNRTTS